MMQKNKKKNQCPFCELQTDVVARNNMAIAVADKYPIVKGHILITSLRHVGSFFDLDTKERNACIELVEEMRRKILKEDKTVSGFNIGFNDGKDAGQTIFHCHIHLIPRRKGDVINPRGGVRNIIAGKANY